MQELTYSLAPDDWAICFQNDCPMKDTIFPSHRIHIGLHGFPTTWKTIYAYVLTVFHLIGKPYPTNQPTLSPRIVHDRGVHQLHPRRPRRLQPPPHAQPHRRLRGGCRPRRMVCRLSKEGVHPIVTIIHPRDKYHFTLGTNAISP